MAVRVKKADGALDLLFHVFALHAHLVARHAVFSAGQLTKGSFHKPLIERIIIDDGGGVRTVRDRAMGARGILFHDGPVAQIADFDSRIAVCHRLVKFHKAKITVYNINIVFKVYIHPQASRLFSVIGLSLWIYRCPRQSFPLIFLKRVVRY